MTHREAVLFIYLLTFSLGIGATLLTMTGLLGNIIITVQTLSIISLIVIIMARKTNSENKRNGK